MDFFKYSHGLGLHDPDFPDLSHLPGLHRMEEPDHPFPWRDRLPVMSTEQAMIARYRVRVWKFALSVTWNRPDDPPITGAVEHELSSPATSERGVMGAAGFGRLSASPWLDNPTLGQVFLNVFGGVGPSGTYFNEESDFDGSVNGGDLLFSLGWRISVGATWRQLVCGNWLGSAPSSFSAPVGSCELRLLGETFPFPVFLPASTPAGYTIASLESYFEPLEYWTYGGRFDAGTGEPT